MLELIPNTLEMVRMLAADNLWLASGLFFLLYIAATVFSLPGAGALTITSGAIFGLGLGGLLSASGAWIGAMIIFLLVKYFGNDYFKSKLESPKLNKMTTLLRKHELKGLLFIRCTPIFPFFVTNILCGVLCIGTRNYAIATAVGMFWSFIYAGVGAGAFSLLTLGA